jgi:hypothetical protein
VGVSILCGDPVTRFLAILIFQPTIWINDLNAMNRFFYVVLARGRRRWRLRHGWQNAERKNSDWKALLDPPDAARQRLTKIHWLPLL